MLAYSFHSPDKVASTLREVRRLVLLLKLYGKLSSNSGKFIDQGGEINPTIHMGMYEVSSLPLQQEKQLVHSSSSSKP